MTVVGVVDESKVYNVTCRSRFGFYSFRIRLSQVTRLSFTQLTEQDAVMCKKENHKLIV